MKKKTKKLPKFNSESQEQAFWAKHSPLDYFNSTKAKRVSFPNLKPSTKSISIRLPEDLISSLKRLADNYDVPYQSLLKILLAKQVRAEFEALGRGGS